MWLCHTLLRIPPPARYASNMSLPEVLSMLFAHIQPQSLLLGNVTFGGFALFVKIVQRCRNLLLSNTQEVADSLPTELLLTIQSALLVETEVVEALWYAARPVIHALLEMPSDEETDEALGVHGMPQRIGEAVSSSFGRHIHRIFRRRNPRISHPTMF